MKLSEAQDLIAGAHLRQGYVVMFEVRKYGMLYSDHFPNVHVGEAGIATEEEAWELAAQFARYKHINPVVNVYVASASYFVPVGNYSERMLNRYSPG